MKPTVDHQDFSKRLRTLRTRNAIVRSQFQAPKSQTHCKTRRAQPFTGLARRINLPNEGNTVLKGSPLSLQWRRKLARESMSIPIEPGNESPPFDCYHSFSQYAVLRRNCKRAERQIGYVFHNKSLMHTALLHSTSLLHKAFLKTTEAQQKLAWLGDSLLYLFITEEIVQRYPDDPQGDWNAARRRLIDRATLASGSNALGLRDLIVVGQRCQRELLGINTSGELYEAVLGAVYLDAGLPQAHKFFSKTFSLPDSISQIDNEFSLSSSGSVPSFQHGIARAYFKARRQTKMRQWRPPKPTNHTLKQAVSKTVRSVESSLLTSRYGMSRDLEARAEKLTKIKFADSRLWLIVLLHRSFLITPPQEHHEEDMKLIKEQEKVSHLGDVVIMLALTDYILYIAGSKPEWTMAAMNERRMLLNSRRHLGRIARNIGLADLAILGDSISKDVLREADRSLVDMLGRLIGTVYVDRGLRAASQYFIELLSAADIQEFAQI